MNAFLGITSQTSDLLSKVDWANHPLGPVQLWPQSLRANISLILGSRFPMYVIWGPQQIFVYNDAYLPLIGNIKHPAGLAQVFKTVWPEVYPDLKPMIESVIGGNSFYLEDHQMFLERKGLPEECYFTFSYSPLTDDDGKIDGVLCSCFETTSRVKSEQLAKEQKAFFERNIDNSPAMLWITEVDGSCTYLSRQWYEFTGQNEIEALGFGWLKAVHPEDSKRAGEIFIEANDNRKPFRFEYRLRDRNGNYRWAIDAGNPRYDVQGNYQGLAGSVVDIHDRKMAEAQYILERNKLNAIFENAPAGMALYVGHDLVFERVNPPHQKIWGNRQLVGLPLTVACPEMIGQQFPKLLLQVLESGSPIVGREVMAKIADSEGVLHERYFDFSYLRISDDNGKPYGVLNHQVDVTDRVRSQQALAQSENRLSLALNSGKIGFWEWNSSTRRMYLSDSLMADWGIDPDNFEFVLENAMARIHPEDQARVWKDIQTATFENKNYDTEYRVIRPSGEIIWINAKGLLTVDEHGNPVTLNGISMNITERKKNTEELEKSRREALFAMNEAERANDLKSAFLANMSHEIRTPLGAMMGFADLLRDPGLSSEERSTYIDILFRNGEGLSVIINDILDLSKVEAGHLSLEYTDCDIRQISEDVLSLLRVKAREKDLVLDFQPEDSAPATIVGDPTRVRQILLNIVGNAIKFTQIGKVTLRLYGCKTDDGRAAACFDVQDTGIGLSEEQIGRMFEMFVQADGTMTRKFGGTGLGLALSRRLARAMGGEVSIVQSKLGAGTTFKIMVADQPELRSDLQPAAIQKTKPLVEGSERLQGLRILVVDDSPDNRQLIWHYLSRQGAIVEAAENGYLGYRAALVDNYDVVLMDIQMPVMDGYTATAKLREAGFKQPIIALTAHAMSDVRRKAIAVGYTDHLPKPINPTELINRIAESVQRT